MLKLRKHLNLLPAITSRFSTMAAHAALRFRTSFPRINGEVRMENVENWLRYSASLCPPLQTSCATPAQPISCSGAGQQVVGLGVAHQHVHVVVRSGHGQVIEGEQRLGIELRDEAGGGGHAVRVSEDVLWQESAPESALESAPESVARRKRLDLLHPHLVVAVLHEVAVGQTGDVLALRDPGLGREGRLAVCAAAVEDPLERRRKGSGCTYSSAF